MRNCCELGKQGTPPTFQQFQAAVEEFAGNLIKDILFAAVLFQVTIEEEFDIPSVMSQRDEVFGTDSSAW